MHNEVNWSIFDVSFLLMSVQFQLYFYSHQIKTATDSLFQRPHINFISNPQLYSFDLYINPLGRYYVVVRLGDAKAALMCSQGLKIMLSSTPGVRV